MYYWFKDCKPLISQLCSNYTNLLCLLLSFGRSLSATSISASKEASSLPCLKLILAANFGDIILSKIGDLILSAIGEKIFSEIGVRILSEMGDKIFSQWLHKTRCFGIIDDDDDVDGPGFEVKTTTLGSSTLRAIVHTEQLTLHKDSSYTKRGTKIWGRLWQLLRFWDKVLTWIY